MLVAGDLAMGRWHNGDEGVRHWADIYYPAWIKRMEAHGLKFYVALGDHDIGDNPWNPGDKKTKLVPEFKKAFRDHLKMPTNGPEHMKGTAYSFSHKEVLFIAVDVYEEDPEEGIALRVAGKQLAWLERTLTENADARHIVVMGHTPILGPVRAKSSSRLMLQQGRESPLWQTMKKHGGDLYLCGEVHDVTCIERDGVQQIAHGGLFGYNPQVNYLVGTVSPKQIRLELKEIDIICRGESLWQVGPNRPHETVIISDEMKKRGFRSIGTMIIDKSTGRKLAKNKTGRFDEKDNPKSRPRNASSRVRTSARKS